MAYSYLFDPTAAREYEEAFSWYEKKSYVAADNFIICVQEAITAICADPTDIEAVIRTYANCL